MLKVMLAWFDWWRLIDVSDISDIILVATIIYLILIFIRQTKAYLVLYSILALFGVNYLSAKFDLTLTRQLFQPLLSFFLFLFVVIFQREIRRFFDWFFNPKYYFGKNIKSRDLSELLTRTLLELANKRTGALIVLPGRQSLDNLVDSGFALDGKLSLPLLLSIFETHSPGHDGAVIIQHGRLWRFGVHLPLAETFDNSQIGGTRHRAAIGLSEHSDALIIVVSEERGEISLAHQGELKKIDQAEKLQQEIATYLKSQTSNNEMSFWRYFLKKNILLKLLALSLSFVLWFTLVFQIGSATQSYEIHPEFKFLPKNSQVKILKPSRGSIQLTFSGKERDFRNLDQRNIKVAIDLSQKPLGWQEIDLGEEHLIYPSYLKLTKINPDKISLLLEKTKVE